MPKNIAGYSKEDINDYYSDISYLVKMVKHWPKNDSELQEFLDRTTVLTPEPPEFSDLRGALSKIQDSSRALGLPQYFTPKVAQLLARNLYASIPRQKYYLQFLQKQRKCASASPQLFSVIQLEEKYQYHLYRKDRAARGAGYGLPFMKWRLTPGCSTFYSEAIK